VARFWATGSLLALVPVCGMGIPSGRLLMFIGLGGMGLIAQFAGGLLRSGRNEGSKDFQSCSGGSGDARRLRPAARCRE
jgi:hypothetical protein